MKSLKIIIFRDTDKPYTIIIPSTVLVAVTFIALALVTVLSFSLISNVLLYAKTKGEPQLQMASQSTVDQQQLQANQEAVDLDPAGEQQQNDNSSDDGNESDIATIDDPGDLVENVTDADQTDVSQVNTSDSDGEQPDAEGENATQQPLSAESYALSEPGANVQAEINGNIINRSNSVAFNAQVAKVNPSSTAFTGRFVVALTDAQGNGGSTYPEGLVVTGGKVETPQRGTTFSIRRLRNYNSIQLPKQSSVESVYIMLFVYTEDGSELLWRKAVPLP